MSSKKYYQECSDQGQILIRRAYELTYPSAESYRFLDYYLNQECHIFITRVWDCNFYLGNAFKYLWRLGKKSRWFNRDLNMYRDLEKAGWYLNKWLEYDNLNFANKQRSEYEQLRSQLIRNLYLNVVFLE